MYGRTRSRPTHKYPVLIACLRVMWYKVRFVIVFAQYLTDIGITITPVKKKERGIITLLWSLWSLETQPFFEENFLNIIVIHWVFLWSLLQWNKWRRTGEGIALPRPLSFFLTAAHPLYTNFFLSSAFPDGGSYIFHQGNTEHSPAKITPAPRAILVSINWTGNYSEAWRHGEKHFSAIWKMPL